MHSNRFECPDTLIAYQPRSKTYGIIIHDGGCGGLAAILAVVAAATDVKLK